jgi:DNA-binding Lrp family transcriptional regulator
MKIDKEREFSFFFHIFLFIVLCVCWEFLSNFFQFLWESKSLTWGNIWGGIKSNISWSLLFGFVVTSLKFLIGIRNDLYKWRKEIIQTYYKGFHALLSSETKENFEALEKLLSMGASHSRLRGVTYDFIISSLASIGKNGFVMVDATVSDYVKYIKEIVGKSNQISMTCVVRPYWFVVDEIQGVTLPPYIKSKDEFGKGEHLKYFGKDPSFRAKRYLVVDEHMIAEMLLTAYIDKCIFKTQNNCPICSSCSSDACYIHNDRIILKDTIDDIPEIFWFKKEVNEKMGVTLSYTLIRHIRRKVHEELDDRVYILSPEPGMEIRFEFANLEKGILRIRWGDKAVPLAWIDSFNVKVDPKNGKHDDTHGHKFYNTFKGVLKDEIKEEIKGYLKLLAREIGGEETSGGKEGYFNEKNVEDIGSKDANIIKKLLANGKQEFRNIILNAIKKLCDDLGSKSLSQIYDELITFYKENGIAKVAYIVTYDPAKPRYPVRVARWKFNWDGDENEEEGILNAPG